MSTASLHVFEFGDFRLDGRRRLLSHRDGAAVSLTAKAFDTLVYLVEHEGIVLHKDELMRALWADTVVEENNLNQNISILRRALGEHRGDHRYIATVPERGYQFVAKVRIVDESPGQREPTADDDLELAYRAFFGWIQSPEGQAIVARGYAPLLEVVPFSG